MYKAARRIVEKLRLHGHEAFFAGGWVRDSLLNRKPKDIDIATSARPEDVLRIFPHSLAIGARYGVVQIRTYRRNYEVATFRSDGAYLDGRHPSSVVYTDPEEDASRRDFTINGLFYDPISDRLIDYVDGRADIDKKRIRTIGNPYKRFVEDKLRMLRAIRFSCDLNFKITRGTWKVIQELAPEIVQVSGERIRDELARILTGPAPDSGLDMLHRSGLLHQVLPEIESSDGTTPASGSSSAGFVKTGTALALLRNPSIPLAFGTLLHKLGIPSGAIHKDPGALELYARTQGEKTDTICRRLRMSRKETDRVVDLVHSQPLFWRANKIKESALKRFLRKPDISDHLELNRVYALSHKLPLDCYQFCRSKLIEYARNPLESPLIKGEDLIALGYHPGPLFKKILRAIEDLQLEGMLRTRKDAVKHVREAFPLKRDP